MTFDEWHKANAKYMEPVDIVDWCREAYEAGRADENEACAKVCEDLLADEFINRTEATVWDVATLDCAAAIRARGQV